MAINSRMIQIALIIVVVNFIILFFIQLPKDTGVKTMFPSVVGDMILRNNESGLQTITKIVAFDNFSGNIKQGYMANYSSKNATMIVFVAQMTDNITSEKSLENMVIRDGYNNNSDVNFNNNSIIKLPVQNPKVYVIRKIKNGLWHYTYAKTDKVYWIGFSNTDINYQASIMMETYQKFDN